MRYLSYYMSTFGHQGKLIKEKVVLEKVLLGLCGKRVKELICRKIGCGEQF